MKRIGLLLVVLLSAALLPLAAQKTEEDQKPTAKYNLATELKLKGTIEEVKKVGSDTYLVVKSAAGLQDVYVAPSEFLSDLQCVFTKGDEVEIVGSRVKVEAADHVLARQIIKGQLTLNLRDPKGAPAWTWWKKG
jgi:hypothetical protein